MKPPDRQIRALTEADKPQWLPLWQEYQRFYESTIPPAVTDTTWQRFLDPAEPMHALGAFNGHGKLLGFVHCIFHRSCWTTADYCYLQDLFTDPATRKQGVGRALIEAVYVFAQSQGASRVHWLTQETNQIGLALYDQMAVKSGFLQYKKVF